MFVLVLVNFVSSGDGGNGGDGINFTLINLKNRKGKIRLGHQRQRLALK